MATFNDAVSLVRELQEKTYPFAVKESITLSQFAEAAGHKGDLASSILPHFIHSCN